MAGEACVFDCADGLANGATTRFGVGNIPCAFSGGVAYGSTDRLRGWDAFGISEISRVLGIFVSFEDEQEDDGCGEPRRFVRF